MRIRSICDVARALRTPSTVPLFSTRVPPKANKPDGTSLPPVIMIHGVLASESTYRSVMKRPGFVPYREVISIDLRNHGKSPHVFVEDGMRFEYMGADVSAFLDAEGIEKACLIGHSMGGKVAMQVALSEPEKVSELIVVDVAPIAYPVGKDPSDPYTVSRAMRAINLEKVTNREQVNAALKVGGVGPESVRQFAMTNLTTSDNPNSTYQWRVNLEGIQAALSDLATFPHHDSVYTGPTCVIRGGKSKYVPFQAMRAFTKLFPNTKLVTISDAGHWLQAQTPDDFVRAVNDFLGE